MEESRKGKLFRDYFPNPVWFQWSKSLKGPEDTGEPQQARDWDRECIRRADWGGGNQAIHEGGDLVYAAFLVKGILNWPKPG